MKHVISKRIKTLLVIIAINLAILSIPTVIIYSNIENLIVKELAKNAMNTASTAASFIERDIEPYRELSSVSVYQTNYYDKEYYESMLLLFQKLKKETGASFIFTEKKVAEDQIQYILDGEDPSSDNFSPIGSVDTISEEEAAAFNEGKITATGMIRDPVWGDYLTGFAPIIDERDQKTIGLVGVDFSLGYINGIISNIKYVLLFCFCFLATFASLGMYTIMSQKYRTFEHDQLTGLFSKRFFDQQIVRIMDRSRRIKKTFSLAMFDIDNFKEINDRYGHIVGDDVLRSVGILIKKNLRHADICFRYGGDELILVLPDTDAMEARQICERIRTVFREYQFNIDETTFLITMSIGLAQWDGRMSIQDLVGYVDKEMYLSKKEGKNRISVHDSFSNSSVSPD